MHPARTRLAENGINAYTLSAISTRNIPFFEHSTRFLTSDYCFYFHFFIETDSFSLLKLTLKFTQFIR